MPLRPPARAPGDPATRTPSSRPGAPRRAAVPTCAPPAPSPPASRDKKRPPERPEALLSRSWPSATLRRPPARRAPGPAPPRALAPAGSGDRPVGPTAPGPAAAAARFSLSLGPEAVLLIQRRHLERQQLARPRRPLPSPEAGARSLLGPGPSPGPRAKAVGPRRGRDPGGLGARPPGAPLLPRGRQTPDPGPRTADLRRVLKVSLLNDQHKYDDVEYEEEVPAVDEDLVRRCTEWLRGVESAAAVRHVRPLGTLPHLSTL
ncbi:proline-rich protein 18 [Saccopteryx leptura]|uniref:proline-rich protein 18 n=1 Tax=Saccopteryx leptura TaxID=249018 RepID=UPI00339BC722